MSQNRIIEDLRPLKLSFTDLNSLVIIPTIGDGNCYFHSILRAFNTSYIGAKTVFDRINLTRTFRNALSDRLTEIDPLTGKDYYSGLNNGRLEEFSQGVKEYSKDALKKELMGSDPVDNIYQELISNAINKDIYIIDGETKDMYNIGTAYTLYYKGRNSIVLYYTPGHFEVVGVKRTNGNIDTIFTPEHKFIEACRERLLSSIRLDRKTSPVRSLKSVATPRSSPSPTRVSFSDETKSSKSNTATSPMRVTTLRAASPKK
jgi:hypothetical protein